MKDSVKVVIEKLLEVNTDISLGSVVGIVVSLLSPEEYQELAAENPGLTELIDNALKEGVEELDEETHQRLSDNGVLCKD